jgi:hypothetical protein
MMRTASKTKLGAVAFSRRCFQGICIGGSFDLKTAQSARSLPMLKRLLSVPTICKRVDRSPPFTRALMASGAVDAFITDSGIYAGTDETVRQIVAILQEKDRLQSGIPLATTRRPSAKRGAVASTEP